jgi:putative hydrolase of HD superfamily
MQGLDQQLAFVAEIGRLKGVLRQTVLAGLGRRENSAEHSWHLAMMAIALAEHAPAGTDLNRVIGMVLIHDIVEIDAGDLYAYADRSEQDKQEIAEQVAAERIFAILPGLQARTIRQLWEEFTARRSPEARFARAIDRLQPMLENMAVGGGTWQAHGVTADQVLDKVRLIEEGSPALGSYARNLVARAVASGILAPAPGPDADRRLKPAGRHRSGAGRGPVGGRSWKEDQLDRRDEADRDDEDPQGERGQAPADPGPDDASGG